MLLFVAYSCFAQKDSTSKADPGTTTTKKVAANSSLKGNGSAIFFTGKNYRKEWVTPIEVPVLNLSTAYGGLKPTKLGGGKQTKSLRVENAEGKEWALRSVEKFPEKAVPAELRGTVAAKIVAGGISGSYPYAIVSMPPLSRAAKVLYLKDSIVYITDDPILGEYRGKFKNTLVLMEERQASGFINDIDGGKKDKMISTEELVYKLANDKNTRVDPIAILRARLLDNFVMDFDRHQGQWDWVALSTGDVTTYYPVPIDRDQAFYRLSGGFITKFVKGKNALPQLEGFKEKAKDISRFNKPEQSFDRFFLNGLSEEDWSKTIDEFLSAMTDDVIETALRLQPKEIQDYSVEKIITTLKNKRKYFKEDMMKYYRFISKTVTIVGTNRRELVTI
ncbi:MAG TPA: hypothetical protein VFI06_00760, partial [Chitinophagaceae bacterium]|nr:hypothetical protein [Chitinophagaceae bacterium]